MIRVRCPICDKRLEIGDLGELPSFPFCSDRCRLIDVGRWIDGRYIIPGSRGGGEEPEESLPEAPGDESGQ
jgi:endogenous inhibitor of DNA gyrase (YacG/DUF329 family)